MWKNDHTNKNKRHSKRKLVYLMRYFDVLRRVWDSGGPPLWIPRKYEIFHVYSVPKKRHAVLGKKCTRAQWERNPIKTTKTRPDTLRETWYLIFHDNNNNNNYDLYYVALTYFEKRLLRIIRLQKWVTRRFSAVFTSRESDFELNGKKNK